MIKNKVFNFFKNKNDKRIFVLCFLASICFWIINALSKDYSATIEFPLKFVFNEVKYKSTNELPKKIDVNISAHGWYILQKSLGIGLDTLILEPENLSKLKYISSRKFIELTNGQIMHTRINWIRNDTIFCGFSRNKSKS